MLSCSQKDEPAIRGSHTCTTAVVSRFLTCSCSCAIRRALAAAAAAALAADAEEADTEEEEEVTPPAAGSDVPPAVSPLPPTATPSPVPVPGVAPLLAAPEGTEGAAVTEDEE
jgi:hypothetical protein